MKRKSSRLVYPPPRRPQGSQDPQVLLPPRPTHNCYLHYPPVASEWVLNKTGSAWVCAICHPSALDILSASGGIDGKNAA